MTSTTGLFAAICSSLLLAVAAQAQGTGADSHATASQAHSVDCMKDTYSTSGTGSSHPLKSQRQASAASHLETHGTLPRVYAQCTANQNRAARAECIRRIYESRPESASLASNSMHRPC